MNKEYLKIIYEYGMIAPTKEESDAYLRLAVRTEAFPLGIITPAEYEEITGVKF